MRRIIGLVVGGGIAVFAGTNAMEDNTTRDSHGEVVEPGGVGVLALRLGDCVQLPDEELVMSIEAVPCRDPHDAQVYAELGLSGDGYPGKRAVEEMALDRCMQEWEGAFGEEWALPYDVFALWPTPESWDVGDHEVICMVTRIDGTSLSGDLL